MQTTSPVALVTSATSGIGQAAAIALADDGFAVVGTSNEATDAGSITSGTLLALDASSDQSVQSLVEEVIARFGRIDVLVNIASARRAGSGDASSIEQVEAVFDTNFFATVRMTNAVLPHMLAQGSGRVVTVSPMVGVAAGPAAAASAAVKHAVEGYAESLDHELREHGVRMAVVEPGPASTSFEASGLAHDSPLSIYAARRDIPRDVLATVLRAAEAPDVIAKIIVAASVDPRPKLRYAAGSMATRVSILRRMVPSRTFDRQFRKPTRVSRPASPSPA
ncbi:SDR family NAD(P)-dependent oxidoreductase [Curtobacterium sp. MCPF17_021]|uniref:SDR family NAD(P)-dependent oxidoreductase n=1 Tax=Curtobacterium sp. MCPF17_021 TaxID=2175639 RepID=UPI000DA8CE92|nr:SDR family NAD(P)-dependent oxidoreductase [Curtobacterium sp. MCPF17_021]WIE82389.1 SDR family NAD(P)-dependent oxidoreductase [Curtobacterium sp. MCPF17_021]